MRDVTTFTLPSEWEARYPAPMGIMRKITSVSTFGLVDFRSDKERQARYARQTRDAQREQVKLEQERQRQERAAQKRHG